MSKTAQRKRSAYANGYRIGRYGWPTGVKGYRLGVVDSPAFNLGIADGRRDLADHLAPTKTFWQVLMFIFGYRKP